MEHITLRVDGMTCGGCVASVSKVLGALPGVATVEVSLENRNATIGYEAGTLGIDDMKRAIVDAGFETE